jgi:protein dithiol:quinone oxidoreductase
MSIIHRPLPWLLLAAGALGLEGTALYFQYGMSLDPCVLCVYQRAAVLTILLSLLIGMSAPGRLPARAIGYIGWGAGALWGLYLALQQAGLQLGIIPPSLSCDVNAKFPAWLKLDQWLPSVFKPTGYCEEIQWQLLGLSMPQWVAIIMALYLVILLAMLITEVRVYRSNRRFI